MGLSSGCKASPVHSTHIKDIHNYVHGTSPSHSLLVANASEEVIISGRPFREASTPSRTEPVMLPPECDQGLDDFRQMMAAKGLFTIVL